MVAELQEHIAGNDRLQEFASSAAALLECRPADHLLRMNLAPLMGRRDAAFDVAEYLINSGGLASVSGEQRRRAYRCVCGLLGAACESSRLVAMRLSSPDTRRRESNLLNHLLMLYSLSSALANFFELPGFMRNDTDSGKGEGISGIDNHEVDRISGVMSGVELDLLRQLTGCFQRSQIRVARYRGYANKNFSADNARRYRDAYNGCLNSCKARMSGFDLNKICEYQN